MNVKTVIIVVCLLLFCAFLGIKLMTLSQDRFSFSFPLNIGRNEILTSLPSGRYELVVSTNYSSKTFGVIPPQREYSSQMNLEVSSAQGVLIHGNNPHYLVFSLSKENAGKVRLIADVQKQYENETLVLHLARGF